MDSWLSGVDAWLSGVDACLSGVDAWLSRVDSWFEGTKEEGSGGGVARRGRVSDDEFEQNMNDI